MNEEGRKKEEQDVAHLRENKLLHVLYFLVLKLETELDFYIGQVGDQIILTLTVLTNSAMCGEFVKLN